MKIKVKKLIQAAVVPSQTHAGDAAWDLHAIEDITLEPGQRHVFGLGVAVDFPTGHVAMFKDRGSLGSKGIHTLAGVVDATYRGEWKVVLLNTSSEPYPVKVGDRIAQCLFIPVASPEIVEAETLTDTSRGTGAFGSTGK